MAPGDSCTERAGTDGRDRGSPRGLDPALLPPLIVAWRDAAAGESGAVHDELRTRASTGSAEPLTRLAELARQARRALDARDLTGFARCVDESFDARRELMALDPRHLEMITAARSCGASANYTGSGGAIVAVCEHDGRAAVEGALQAIGCRTIALAA